jgi:DNA (cytosine-5)-methyltransferase 1
LFSGVGGLSLGAARAGFRVAASVELDPIAAKSHLDNFPKTNHLELDIGRLKGQVLLEAAGLQRGEFSGLIGGPPCQGFSLIGKRREDDPRNDLFSHFFRLVRETRPAFFVAENVPGVLAKKNASLVEAALGLVPRAYKILAPIEIKANLYGAPTTRKRIFFIGFDPDRLDTTSEPEFAAPESIESVTVGKALRGLPSVDENWQTEPESWRIVGDLPDSEYYRRVMDKVPRDVGNSHALTLLRNKRQVSGFLGTKHNYETIKRFDALAYGEVDPIYRSPRLDPKGFCPTLRAGTGSDKGSFQAVRPIHPKSPRVISPREAARLQGFPDWFVFHPTKWHSFRQIGNSVSPLVAEEILKTLANKFSTKLQP